MYPTESDPELSKAPPVNYSRALKEVATSGADLLHKELALLRAEFTESLDRVRDHVLEVVVFGGVCVLSLIPFMFFLIFGLARLMDRPVWMSSLIWAVAFAVMGGVLAYRAYRKIKHEDVKFTRTRASIERTTRTFQTELEKLKHAIKGDRYGSAH